MSWNRFNSFWGTSRFRQPKRYLGCKQRGHNAQRVAGLAGSSLWFWPLYGSEFNPEAKCRERFVIAETADLDKEQMYAKERALISEIKAQLTRGRKCQVYAVYTTKHDVITRLEGLLRAQGIRADVLRASIPTHKREAWYREHQRRGIDVAIC